MDKEKGLQPGQPPSCPSGTPLRAPHCWEQRPSCHCLCGCLARGAGNTQKPREARQCSPTALCPRPSLAGPLRGCLQGSPAAGTTGPSAAGSPAEAVGSPLAPGRGLTGGGALSRSGLIATSSFNFLMY